MPLRQYTAEEGVGRAITKAARAEAERLKLVSANIVVYDTYMREIAAERYNVDLASATKACLAKIKAIKEELPLVEVSTVCEACSPSLAYGLLVGKAAVQGAVRVDGLGFAAASCIFDTGCDVRVLDVGLRAAGYTVLGGRGWLEARQFVGHREHDRRVFPAPGWATYIKALSPCTEYALLEERVETRAAEFCQMRAEATDTIARFVSTNRTRSSSRRK